MELLEYECLSGVVLCKLSYSASIFNITRQILFYIYFKVNKTKTKNTLKICKQNNYELVKLYLEKTLQYLAKKTG